MPTAFNRFIARVSSACRQHQTNVHPTRTNVEHGQRYVEVDKSYPRGLTWLSHRADFGRRTQGHRRLRRRDGSFHILCMALYDRPSASRQHSHAQEEGRRPHPENYQRSHSHPCHGDPRSFGRLQERRTFAECCSCLSLHALTAARIASSRSTR